MKRLRALLAVVIAVLPPWIVAAAWARWALGVVDAQERSIRPLSGLAFATFAQIVWCWNHGYGWVQTVHRGYAEDWRWGGHYAPVLFASAWLSRLSESPWALCRVQVVLIALGCLPAWLLGFAEAGLLGAVAGVTLYAGNAAIAHIALADYQDLALCLPLFPLAVWAARHASLPVWLLAATLLGATREEIVVLLPIVGLTGGWRRALWGVVVAGGYFLVYRSMGPSPYPNPLTSIASWQASRGLADPDRFTGIEWSLYGTVVGSSWPWLVFAPVTALAALPTLLFHHQDPTSVRSIISPAVHHFAPLVGAAAAAGIVGITRLMRIHRAIAVLMLVGLAGTTAYSMRIWRGALIEYGVRVQTVRDHPAWALIAQVPEDAVLLVPESIAPAAANRRWTVTPDSIGDRVKASQITWGVDDGRFTGEVVTTNGGWRLLKNPSVKADVTPQPTGGRQ